MKNIRPFIKVCLLLNLILFAACEKNNEADQIEEGAVIMSNIKLAYEYPVTRTSEEWLNLSDEERIEISQIPEQVLSALSTEQLINVVFANPLLSDIHTGQNIEMGIAKFSRDCNGVIILMQRDDLTDELIKAYALRLDRIEELNKGYAQKAKEEYIRDLSNIELVGTNLAIFSHGLSSAIVDKSKLTGVLQILWKGYEAKVGKRSYFEGLGLNSNLYARAHFLAFTEGFPISVSMRELTFSSVSTEAINEQTRQVLRANGLLK